MIKIPEEMTREELIESVKDLRKSLAELHISFLRGLVMEIESGELKVQDLDFDLRTKFYQLLVNNS